MALSFHPDVARKVSGFARAFNPDLACLMSVNEIGQNAAMVMR
jgi:hypothetical protein